MQIARHVERDRFDEYHDALFFAGKADRLAQHQRGIVPVGRAGDDKARNVAQDGERIVVVEMAAEPALIAEPRDPHYHWVGEVAV